MIVFVIVVMVFGVTAEPTVKDSEVEVKLQFVEFDLEDFCVAKNEAEWKFLNGTDPNLKKVLDVEMKESELYKKEVDVLQRHVGKRKFKNERLQRLVTIFTHPGASLLGNAEFKEYRDYSIKLDEMMGTMEIECPFQPNAPNAENSKKLKPEEENCTINYNQLEKILYKEKNPDTLKKIWVQWFEEVARENEKTKYDFVQQLSMLDLEAEQNGEEELTDYWLNMAEITWVNYNSVKNLWEEILPLYNKLKHFMTSLAIQNFDTGVLKDKKLIPAHILGSLESTDWVTAAEKLGAFDRLDVYKELKNSLGRKNIKGLYRVADDMTTELGLLPQSFYEKSRFEEPGKRCRNAITNYCERKNSIRIMSCTDDHISVRDFLRVAENTMKIKYLELSGKEDTENGFLFREGPRDSVLHEAMESLSSLKAFWPQALQNQNIFRNESLEKQKILGLIINALDVVPPLPYYLATDLWRINALQEIDLTLAENGAEITTLTPSQTLNVSNEAYYPTKAYDSANLTSDWWNYREQYQGIGSPDGKQYEDYLQDKNIIWNKPYLSKFLGKLLQFQILEHLPDGKFRSDKVDLVALMRKGKSEPWQVLVEKLLNITEISTGPLLRYFKPLEEFLDKGIKFKNDTQIFSTDDFNFAPQSYSLVPKHIGGDKSSEGSDALFFSLIVIAAVGIVAVIISIGRRRYKKRMRGNERQRRLAEL